MTVPPFHPCRNRIVLIDGGIAIHLNSEAGENPSGIEMFHSRVADAERIGVKCGDVDNFLGKKRERQLLLRISLGSRTIIFLRKNPFHIILQIP